MGCSGCGSSGILPGSVTARKRALERQGIRVRGHSSSGIIKSSKRLLKESGKVEVVKEAAIPVVTTEAVIDTSSTEEETAAALFLADGVDDESADSFSN